MELDTLGLNGFQKFNYLFLTAFQKAIQKYLEANRDEVGKALLNTLLNSPGPKRAKTIPEKQDACLMKLWEFFVEIEKSVESSRTIKKYIQYSPSKKIEIKLSTHLSYHVHNYLNEIYILQCRLDAFRKIVIRTYKNDIGNTEPVESAIDILLTSFKSLVNLRGYHVHKFRFESPEIDRLSEIELLLSFPGDTIAYALLPEAQRAAKKKWLQTLANNDLAISKILDNYANLLTPIIFNPNGTWKCPSKV